MKGNVIEEKSTDLDASVAGEFITRSAEETFELARQIGGKTGDRAIFLLSGDLGAGKTLFTKGLAAGLGIDPAEVTSPSFTLINIYEEKLYHVDLYRLETRACSGLGLEEILEKNAVTVIEWAERLGFVPAGATAVEIQHLSDSERKIIIRRASRSLAS